VVGDVVAERAGDRVRRARRCPEGDGSRQSQLLRSGQTFSNGSDFRFEVIAAGVGNDLAYNVGYETSLVSLDGGPVGPSRIRVTHVYRRENGEWRMVHRHGDRPPSTG
jgi:ketosteroid isomerase-like protein